MQGSGKWLHLLFATLVPGLGEREEFFCGGPARRGEVVYLPATLWAKQVISDIGGRVSSEGDKCSAVRAVYVNELNLSPSSADDKPPSYPTDIYGAGATRQTDAQWRTFLVSIVGGCHYFSMCRAGW
jgi:hypothetical protein